VDLTVDQATREIERRLAPWLKLPPEVTVVLADTRAVQLVRGPHLVRPDGTVGLGVYGSVYVDDLTLPEARRVIEQHLSQFFLNPEVSLDVSGFNSKVYYVITDGAGLGEQVTRLPVTGKTTVLDAVGQIGGLSPVSYKKFIWVARPTPDGTCGEQTLPVNWRGIVERGDTSTNYQLFPGDRVYIKGKPLVAYDNFLARLFSPIERIFGITLLGDTVYRSIATPIQGAGSTTVGSPTTSGILP
jgi:polysaccharide export outer membrane protein